MAKVIRDLLERAEAEVAHELEERRVSMLKERIRELKAARLVVAKLESQLAKFLDEPIDDGVFDDGDA